VKRRLGGAWARFSLLLSPPGDAALRGLELDLHRLPTFEQGWRRVCETAWTLGFVELALEPADEAETFLPARHDAAPEGGGRGVLGRFGDWALAWRGTGESEWAFELVAAGRSLGFVTARRRLGRVDFDPDRFVLAVQALVDRFVTVPWAERPGEPAIVALATPRPAPATE
jgi:hypothetical protein